MVLNTGLSPAISGGNQEFRGPPLLVTGCRRTVSGSVDRPALIARSAYQRCTERKAGPPNPKSTAEITWALTAAAVPSRPQ
jgi:hypothetical protein